jgi:hypothetical protein
MRPIITRLISEVTRLAEDNSAQAKAARLRLIVDDLTEIGDRLAAVEKATGSPGESEIAARS